MLPGDEQVGVRCVLSPPVKSGAGWGRGEKKVIHRELTRLRNTGRTKNGWWRGLGAEGKCPRL